MTSQTLWRQKWRVSEKQGSRDPIELRFVTQLRLGHTSSHIKFQIDPDIFDDFMTSSILLDVVNFDMTSKMTCVGKSRFPWSDWRKIWHAPSFGPYEFAYKISDRYRRFWRRYDVGHFCWRQQNTAKLLTSECRQKCRYRSEIFYANPYGPKEGACQILRQSEHRNPVFSIHVIFDVTVKNWWRHDVGKNVGMNLKFLRWLCMAQMK